MSFDLFNQPKEKSMASATIFRNFTQKVENLSLIAICKRIESDTYKSAIENIQNLIELGKLEEANEAKKQLLGFTPSGTFDNGRKSESITTYSQYIVLDFDKIGKDKVAAIKQIAAAIPHTFCAFISPSGNGLKIIVEVDSPIEYHETAYLQIADYYANTLNLKIDSSGKDLARLCFMSHDPNLYKNINATPFEVDINYENTENKILSEAKEILNSNSMKLKTNPDVTFEHCKRFTDKKITYSEGNRNNYIHLLANNCNRKGLSEAQCIYFCANEFDLESNEIASTVKSAYKNTSEHNSLIDIDNKPSNIAQIEDFLNAKYEFRFNVVTGKLEYKHKNTLTFEPITDFIENSIFRDLLKAEIKINISKLRNILHSDFCQQFNPFENYFYALPPWDEKTDYIELLANTIKTTDTEFWNICLKKWIVALVGCVLDAKVTNQTVIVFSGKQGIGKTTWMENIVPETLKEYLFSGTINPDNKDTLIHLSECMLINLDELENLNKSEIGSLKELITKTFIKIRRAYGHNNEKMFRRASFCGSVNTSQFLNDLTGSRRFLCFEVLEIDYQNKVKIDLVLAQALYLFKNGFVYWFNKNEIDNINKSNERYQIKTMEEELLLTWFKIPEQNQNISYLTATQILTKIAEKGRINTNNATAVSLGKILNKYGFKKVKKFNRYVYEVFEIEYIQVEIESKAPPTG